MFMIAFIAGAHAGAYEVLRLRDGADCARLGTGDAVRDELLALAEADVQPAYVPVRAAECLVADYAADPAFVEHARAWVSEKRWTGLGFVVARNIDSFSLADAVGIAESVAAAPDVATRSRMGSRLRKSAHPEVRAVVEGLDAPEQGR